jgi:hypothetical protein
MRFSRLNILRQNNPKFKINLPALIGLLIFGLSLSLYAKFAQAQPGVSGQSMEVSPPSQEISAKPGETLTVKSKIRNRTEQPLPVTARIQDFVASGDEGQVALTDQGPWSVSNWTTISPTSFTLAPNETKEVTATVKVPANGAAGGRYGSFVFLASGKAEPGKAVLSQEVASLFLIDIEGPKEEKIDILSFTVPGFMEFGPVPFTLTYKNSGNVHLKTYGVIAITDMFGRKVTDLIQTGTNIFPGADRKVSVNWEDKMLFGKYTALAIINTGGTKNDTVTATATFTVIPVRIIAIIILAGIFIFLIRKRLSRAARALMGK